MQDASDNDDFITLYFEKGVRRTIRGPKGFKEAIDKFLEELEIESGSQFSRNQFFMNAARFYIRYLMQARNKGDLINRMQETFAEIDNPQNEDKVEPEKRTE